MDKKGSEADVIFNRASVALAKSQRLIASWLPPRSEEERMNEKTEEQLEQEERDIFAPVPELYVFELSNLAYWIITNSYI